MGLNSYIAKQFADPKGFGGNIISLVMNRQNRPLYDETIRLLSLADSDSVLDIGCGNGYVLGLLARQHNATFVGIDPSREIVESAKRRNRKYTANGKMSFNCQDVSALSFPAESFSKVYTINTVYFWNDLNQSMLEIRRIMKPNGVFINTLYTNEALSRFSHTRFGYKRYAPKELISAGRDAGFTVKAVPFLQQAAICYVYTKSADGVI
ncbi:MAG: class I SAM-dependent methyltransferase [Oscillospiraceae bacterium]|jgi:ubiquinone/menaquinone biosynthesis C-methylase UbiE|nr:class I SAM-dependent methyltransferase [Oscillospiraceae bacterium]